MDHSEPRGDHVAHATQCALCRAYNPQTRSWHHLEYAAQYGHSALAQHLWEAYGRKGNAVEHVCAWVANCLSASTPNVREKPHGAK